jgi:poly-gamma-glutamate synthesis protein (capsule biosynthesis protein)
MLRVVVLLALVLIGCSTEPKTPAADPAPGTAQQSAPVDAHDLGTAAPLEPLAAYSASVRPIGPRVRHRMRYSHRPGCPVPLTDLRYLRMTYVDVDGRAHTGEMVVHKEYAVAVIAVFERLYDARWPIRRMRLVDYYRGDDIVSMAANNTSGYNCRRVAGTHSWSAHAYGAAIDINPVQNPYLTGSSVAPPAGWRFAAIDRSANADVPPGAIREGDEVVRAFARIGWKWGGRWSTSKDYQHFSPAAERLTRLSHG